MHGAASSPARRQFGLLVVSADDWATQAVAAAQRIAQRSPELTITPLRADRSGIDHIPVFNLHLDGLVTRFNDPELIPAARQLGLPMVNISAAELGLPAVHFDEIAIGRAACEHLLAQGAERITYLRWLHDGPIWNGRGSGAAAVCRERSVPFTEVRVGRPEALAPVMADIARHTGLFCANDIIGLWTLRQAHDAGVAVPGHCLVVGVDDSQDICPFTRPTLSSVPLDFESLLTTAFHQLDQLIAGRTPDTPDLAGPLPVALRDSTAIAADSGPLATATDYIRRHASRNPGLEDIAAAAGIHPRALQRLFRKRLGMTPLMAVTRERLAHARTLLAGTDLTVGEISTACGYASQQRFAAAFRREVGEPPGRFRSRIRPA
jgi:LacI family transcriptional regulator